jgi:segregation and condensation protein B
MPEPIDLVEALLFASETPVEPERIREVLELGSSEAARETVAALKERLDAEGRPLQVIEVGGGYRLVTRAELAPWLVRLARSRTRSRLSRSALETLAIIAYRQPASRPDIDAIRGVNSDAVLENLLDRRMIRIGGRKEAPGRPFLYETTREFLVAFGLRDLSDLPKVEGELAVPEAAPEGSAGVLGGPEAPHGAAQEGTAATDTAQQDSGAGGPGLTPGS